MNTAPALKDLSVQELLVIASSQSTGEEPTPETQALVALHERGTREVLEAAITLCGSPHHTERILGARILGELRGELRGDATHRGFPEECCDELLRLATTDKEVEVVIAAVFALGHLGNRRSDDTLAELRSHPEPLVRHGVAFALAGETSPKAVNALLELMNDPEAETRDWATTGIGMTVSIDGVEIRDALVRRLQDEDEITRAEALQGLARREDARVVPYLIHELTKETDPFYLFEDAAKTWLGIDNDQEVSVDELLNQLRS
jgi:HEAT repeat protein